MTDETTKAIEFLTSEMTAGFTRLHQRLDAMQADQERALGNIAARLGSLESTTERMAERIAFVERRIELLEETVSRLDRRTALVEASLTDIKERLSRLSRDILLGRTEDAERYQALALRLAAVEAATKPQ